jgi:hypothetical protein
MLAFRDFPRHMQLLLLAARSRIRTPELEELQQLAQSMTTPEWLELQQAAAIHRIGPLVFETLDRLRAGVVPAAIREVLRLESTLNAYEAMRSASEIRRVTRKFAATGIELTQLKGISLSQRLFGNPNVRHVGDIDLLTPSSDAPNQIALLSELGYHLEAPKARLTPRRTESFMRFWKGFTFADAETGAEIDLHWRLFNNRRHGANRLILDAEYVSVTVFGVPMKTFCPRDAFVYIAAHGSSDGWTYLKSLADVAAFLRMFTQAELDDALLRARACGVHAQISGAVHLANAWLGADAQSPHLLSLDDPQTRFAGERASAMLLRHRFRTARDQSSPLDWMLLERQLVPGGASMLEIAQRYLWRPRLWASVDLPDSLFWMYPLLGALTPPRLHGTRHD